MSDKKIKHDVFLHGYVNTFKTLARDKGGAERKVKKFMNHPGPALAERSSDQRLYPGPPDYKPVA